MFTFTRLKICAEGGRFLLKEKSRGWPILGGDLWCRWGVPGHSKRWYRIAQWMVSPATGIPYQGEDVYTVAVYNAQYTRDHSNCGRALHYYLLSQLLRTSVDNYEPGHTIPSCQVELVWVKEEEHPKRLSHMLHVSGVKPPDTYIRISRNAIHPG